MPNTAAWRWVVVGVIVLSSALNYLDRMILAALAPTIESEFHLAARDYGLIVTAFSLVYAFSSPVMGLAIDRIGLLWGAVLVVGLWSLAGLATGLTVTFAGLLLCRAVLGFAEAGGVPATGKAFALYLEPKDRAIGTGLNQVGLTIGSTAAPLLTAWSAARGNWREAFVIAGVLGFAWIPLWILVARRGVPVHAKLHVERATASDLLRDRRFLALVLANILSMTVYSLWTNWTTLFLVTRHALTAKAANQTYAWIPPIFATAGGLFGGWLARRLIHSGLPLGTARVRASLVGAVLVLASAAAPIVPTPALATAAISIGLFAVTALSVNYYAVPLDLFGPARAAFAVSVLTGSFGLMQAFLSPLIGDWSERFGWSPACFVIALLPLASVGVLKLALRPGELA